MRAILFSTLPFPFAADGHPTGAAYQPPVEGVLAALGFLSDDKPKPSGKHHFYEFKSLV
jgi:hypothetical protein